MALNINTVLFSPQNYFRASFITLFNSMEEVNLVDVLPVSVIFSDDFFHIKNQLSICQIESFNLSTIQTEFLKRLSSKPEHKAIIIGARPKIPFNSSKIIYHSNIADLSKSVICRYLDDLFFNNQPNREI